MNNTKLLLRVIFTYEHSLQENLAIVLYFLYFFRNKKYISEILHKISIFSTKLQQQKKGRGSFWRDLI